MQHNAISVHLALVPDVGFALVRLDQFHIKMTPAVLREVDLFQPRANPTSPFYVAGGPARKKNP